MGIMVPKLEGYLYTLFYDLCATVIQAHIIQAHYHSELYLFFYQVGFQHRGPFCQARY